MEKKNLIRFDWALKRLLRNKANYRVLEGFLSELLHEDITIVSIAESEGTGDSAADKFNRVDILAENSKKELIIIDMQSSNDDDYFIRMQYGVSRVIAKYKRPNDPYAKIRKVYSVNIVYSDIEQGKDYIYRGRNEFYSVHQNELQELSENRQEYLSEENLGFVFPEYYIIKVNNFDDMIKNTLAEWVYYLRNDEIRDEFKAKGLAEAREILRMDNLPENEKQAYRHHIETVIFEKSVIASAIRREKIEAYAEVIIEGRKNGLSIDMLQTITGLNRNWIENFLNSNGYTD